MPLPGPSGSRVRDCRMLSIRRSCTCNEYMKHESSGVEAYEVSEGVDVFGYLFRLLLTITFLRIDKIEFPLRLCPPQGLMNVWYLVRIPCWAYRHRGKSINP